MSSVTMCEFESWFSRMCPGHEMFSTVCKHGGKTWLLYTKAAVRTHFAQSVFTYCAKCKVDFLLSTGTLHRLMLNLPLSPGLTLYKTPLVDHTGELRNQRACWPFVCLAIQHVENDDIRGLIRAVFVVACSADVNRWTTEDDRCMIIEVKID